MPKLTKSVVDVAVPRAKQFTIWCSELKGFGVFVFTEATIGTLVGHSRDTVTGRYIHTVDTLLVMAADTVAGFIRGLLEGKRFRQTSYALDRESREATLARLFEQSVTPANSDTDERMAA
jgi:hypothetical protein